MEYVDIVNNDGMLTGLTVTREKAHSDGLFHRSIHLWIINPKGELLMQKRAMSKTAHPGLWDVSCAGHVESGDTAEETVIKETGEELGIKIEKEDFSLCNRIFSHYVFNSGAYIDNEFIYVFLMKKDIEFEKFKPDSAEVSDIKYISLADFQKKIHEKNHEIAPHYEEYALMLAHPEVRVFI